MVLFASSALLAPWLQVLGNYPVETAGLLLAPRGVGTMVAMLVAGRITNRIDPRSSWRWACPAAAGACRLSTWTPAVSRCDLIRINTIVQGAGLGLVFVPLNVVAFGPLPPAPL